MKSFISRVINLKLFFFCCHRKEISYFGHGHRLLTIVSVMQVTNSQIVRIRLFISRIVDSKIVHFWDHNHYMIVYFCNLLKIRL